MKSDSSNMENCHEKRIQIKGGGWMYTILLPLPRMKVEVKSEVEAKRAIRASIPGGRSTI